MTTIDVHRSFAGIEDEWESLAARQEAPPFMRPRWFKAWSQAFGNGSLAILSAEGPNGLRGVLPLQLRAGVAHSLANYHTPGFGPLTEDPRAIASLLQAATGLARRRVDLRFIGDPDLLAKMHSAVHCSAGRPLVRVLERSPWIDLTTGWEDYRSSLDTKLLRNLERRRRRLEEFGPLELQVSDGTSDLERLLTEGFAVEGSGWKAASGTAIRCEPNVEAFYRGVSAWASSRGWLRLAHLRVSGRAIAFDLSLEHDGRHYLLKTGYDAEFSRFGPGKMLRLDMIRRAFEHGLRVYDFLGDAVPWKLEWTLQQRDRVMVQLFPGSPLGRIERAAFAHGRPLAIKTRTMTRSLKDAS